MCSSRLKKELKGLHAFKCAILFFQLILVVDFSFSQETQIFSMPVEYDTLSLSQYQNVVLQTNNGSDCICVLNNPSSAQNVTVTAMGAPDDVHFDNDSTFNDIHILTVQQQIISMADFKGKKLTIANVTPYATRVLIYYYCTK